MSVINYSKWDKIELSDDEDIECHPNIDKASWVRMMQRKIHQEREDRKMRIAQMKSEHSTNIELRKLIVKMSEDFKAQKEEQNRSMVEQLLRDVHLFDTTRKAKLLDPQSEEYLQIKDVQEVYLMLVSRLLDEGKVERKTNVVIEQLPRILTAELPKLDKRQKELLEKIATEEKEQNKKLTSENIGHEGFSKTIINTKPDPKEQKAKAGKQSQKQIEVLNPDHAQKAIQKSSVQNQSGGGAAGGDADVDLRELSQDEDQMMLDFVKCKDFTESFHFIQQHPEIVQKEFSDHIMARAFKCQMDGKSQEAKRCVKWSLALNYALQMGRDGVGLFYKRMTGEAKEPLALFEQDLESTYNHVKERSKILKAKQNSKDLDEDNSNLTPEQAVVFKTFPKHFQDAMYSGDMNKINESFGKMTEEESARVMADCQKTGLISVLSEEESKQYLPQESDSEKKMVEQ
ncbi:hypothetical protein MIR68_004099 [Amoeboaphelidium protococcarum]|nr:hypothetical protein MIR68_004099 [Amoeboaphelidium protococcarum]